MENQTITKLMTEKQAKERYKICRNTLVKIAKDAGAIRHFGRAVRYDVEKLDKAVENL